MNQINNEETSRICSNCKYFKRHYVLSPSARFSPLNEGHCGNALQKRKTGDTLSAKNAGCDLWQPYELEKLKRQYSMESTLQSINKKLEDILAVLRDAE